MVSVVMMTYYYCRECDVKFSEEMVPNINKRHHCGETLRIVSHEEGEGEKEADI